MKPEVRITSSSVAVTFAVRVIPRARKTAIAGTREGSLGLLFLADLLDRPKRDIAIVSGQLSRDKRITVSGMTAAQLAETLSDILPA